MGYEDETWWSRFAQPRLHVWAEVDKPLRLVEQVKWQQIKIGIAHTQVNEVGGDINLCYRGFSHIRSINKKQPQS